MIYRLPTRGSTRYRGQYPNACRSVSSANGVTHVELQNGERLVMRSVALLDLPRYGKDFRRYLRDQASIAVNITRVMYGHLLMQRDVAGGQKALIGRWDAAFSAEIN